MKRKKNSGQRGNSMEQFDIIIVGAGPAGIAAGVEAKLAGLNDVVVLEKTDHHCDTIVSLYHEGKRVDSVYRKVSVEPMGALSFDTHDRESFLAWMDGVIADHGLDIRYKHEVFEINVRDGGFEVQSGGGTLAAKTVITAIGIFGKPVKPSYKLASDVKDFIFFSIPAQPPAGQRILVVGGGDSAAEAACFLSDTNQVVLSYRRSEFFRINEQNLCTLDRCCHAENLETRLGIDIEAVDSAEGGVKVTYSDGETDVYDAIYYFLGGSTPRAFLEKAGVRYSGKSPMVDEHGETDIPGLFLAGDLVAEKGTIMAAFNSAAAVIKRIRQTYLHPA